jgi:hypothetical protein
VREHARRHAVESLNLQSNALRYTVVCFVLMFVLIGFVLIMIYGNLYLVCVITATVRASNGARTTDTPDAASRVLSPPAAGESGGPQGDHGFNPRSDAQLHLGGHRRVSGRDDGVRPRFRKVQAERLHTAGVRSLNLVDQLLLSDVSSLWSAPEQFIAAVPSRLVEEEACNEGHEEVRREQHRERHEV